MCDAAFMSKLKIIIVSTSKRIQNSNSSRLLTKQIIFDVFFFIYDKECLQGARCRDGNRAGSDRVECMDTQT